MGFLLSYLKNTESSQSFYLKTRKLKVTKSSRKGIQRNFNDERSTSEKYLLNKDIALKRPFLFDNCVF